MAKLPTYAVLSVLAVSLLCGCSNGSDASKASPAENKYGTVKAGVLTVAEDENYPPEIFKNPDGSLGGFDYDIMTAVAQQMGLKVEFKEVKFEQAIIGLKAKQYDVYPGLYVNPDRLSAIGMVPYFETGNALVGKAGGAAPTTADELCGLHVGVINGAAAIASLKDQSAACTQDGKSPIQVSQFPSDPEVSQALIAGNVDVQLTSSSVAADVVAKQPSLKVTSSALIYPSVVAMGIPQGDAQLEKGLSDAVSALVANSTLPSIYRKYGLNPVVEADVNSASTGS